jgi:hypothetical protein
VCLGCRRPISRLGLVVTARKVYSFLSRSSMSSPSPPFDLEIGIATTRSSDQTQYPSPCSPRPFPQSSVPKGTLGSASTPRFSPRGAPRCRKLSVINALAKAEGVGAGKGSSLKRHQVGQVRGIRRRTTGNDGGDKGEAANSSAYQHLVRNQNNFFTQ